MILGFTGTQVGMTAVQYAERREGVAVLEAAPSCITAIASVQTRTCIVWQQSWGFDGLTSPTENVAKRAWCTGDAVTEAKPYLARNRDIVDVTTALLATPQGPEELRSGTWSTVRYARRQTKPLVIVWPNGVVTWEYGSEKF